MSELQAIERVTLAEQVAMQIAAMVQNGRWKPGDKLPPESYLCASLGVGRSSLREALKSLAFIGMVRMRAGDGTYVAEPPTGVLDRILAKGLLKSERDLADVCETRMVLETEMAGLAAERATPEDVQLMETVILAGGEILSAASRTTPQTGCAPTSTRQGYSEVDLKFHLAVAHACHNKLLERLLADIRGLLVEWIEKSQELPGLLENAHEQHERIFKAIADHDAASSRHEMRRHLETFQRAYTLLGKISHSGSPTDLPEANTKAGRSAWSNV
jgi:GntR family transcriptional repressor for pyruvate dehydrogenase complex